MNMWPSVNAIKNESEEGREREDLNDNKRENKIRLSKSAYADIIRVKYKYNSLFYISNL